MKAIFNIGHKERGHYGIIGEITDLQYVDGSYAHIGDTVGFVIKDGNIKHTSFVFNDWQGYGFMGWGRMRFVNGVCKEFPEFKLVCVHRFHTEEARNLDNNYNGYYSDDIGNAKFAFYED